MEEKNWLVVVNENVLDAGARVVHADNAFPLRGWERVWSEHASREEAVAELPNARKHVQVP